MEWRQMNDTLTTTYIIMMDGKQIAGNRNIGMARQAVQGKWQTASVELKV